MVALEAMHHDKEVDANLAIIRCSPSHSNVIRSFHNLCLTHFVSAFDFFNKDRVLIVAVALLKYYWADLSKRFLYSLCLYLQVGRVKIDRILV